VLKSAVGVGFMLMSNDYLEKYPGNAERFLLAWKEALLYTAQNRAETDAWFHADSRMPVELLAQLEVVDSNLHATSLSEIDIGLTKKDIAKNQAKTDFMFEHKLISSPLDISSRLWLPLLAE
jgi:ABC-type nitrate/sulfonate/bicarbonate transport system substrate-binding protein